MRQATLEKTIDKLESKKTRLINQSCWTKKPEKIEKLTSDINEIQERLASLYFELMMR